jgi:hypothetical protein
MNGLKLTMKQNPLTGRCSKTFQPCQAVEEFAAARSHFSLETLMLKLRTFRLKSKNRRNSPVARAKRPVIT